MTQVLLKLAITGGILVVVCLVLVRLWRSDIDVAKLVRVDRYFSNKADDVLSFLPTRDPDALYQGDRIIGRVEGARIDETAKVVTFARITDWAYPNEIAAHAFTYQTYNLVLRQVGMMNGSERTLQNVSCKITGRR